MFRTLLLASAASLVGIAAAQAQNAIVGPAVGASGSLSVSIDQVGAGNTLSGAAATGSGNAIVNSSGGNATLDVMQVGTLATNGNRLGVAVRTTGNASVTVRQGRATRNSQAVASTPLEANENTAQITVGNGTSSAGATTVALTQQTNGNTATLNLGNTAGAFLGTLQIAQVGGGGNTVDLTVNGLTTARQFRIAQYGSGNNVAVTAGNVGADVDINIGGVTLADLANIATSPNPAGTALRLDNNAATYDGLDGGVFSAGAVAGISLGATNGFDLRVQGSGNNIQADLTTAADTSRVAALTLTGNGNTLAIYGASSADVRLNTVTVDGTSAGRTLIVDAPAGGVINLSNLTLAGNGSFRTLNSGTISVSGGSTAGMTVLQSGVAHEATLGLGSTSGSTWDVAQTGTLAVQTINVTNTVENAAFYLRQSGTGAHRMSFNNAGAGTVNVIQSGATAQSVTNATFTAATTGGAVNITQSSPTP